MKLIRRFLILLSLLLPLQAAYAQYNPALQSPQAFLGFDLEERLAGWVEAGGTLMLCGEAHKVSGMIGDDSISPETGRGVSGLVLQAEMVPDSPLFWGYHQPGIDVFKGNATVWTVAPDAQVLLRYASEPYRSGYVTPENLALFAGAPLVAGKHQGSGYILYIQEDFAYRAYWLGTNAILANALLFGDKL